MGPTYLHNVDEMLVGCLERLVGRAVRDLLQPVRAVPVGRRLREAAEVKLPERAGRVRPRARGLAVCAHASRGSVTASNHLVAEGYGGAQ